MLNNTTHLTNINSPVRKVEAKVELYEGSTLVNTFAYTDALKSINVERIGEAKFFGFGICQKLNVHLIDSKRELNITTGNSLKVYFGAKGDYTTSLPTFYVSEVHRDENTNELSITAYDALYKAVEHTYAELVLPANINLHDLIASIRAVLGLNGSNHNGGNGWEAVYSGGLNYEGTENLREVLDDVAEATQSIYYVDRGNNLYFKKLDRDGDAVLTIDKEKYFSLDSKTNRRLAKIVHSTELGDNVSAELEVSGSTQYVRDNAFWELRDDIDIVVNDALTAIGGLTINQFYCEWRGNYLLEIGDKIDLITKNDAAVSSYLLNDTINYDGTFAQTTEWEYVEDEAETAENPTSLGTALKQTFARVDKANKQIDLIVSDVNVNTADISSLMMNTESITASVQQMEQTTNDALTNINDELVNLTSRVDATMTAEDVAIQIRTEIDNIEEVNKVITETGFVFDSEGLTISKSGSEMTTQITEDGMTVYRDENEVLTADNIGVKATNLHATTYLMIGEYSRFEDYKGKTCCFWIGG